MNIPDDLRSTFERYEAIARTNRPDWDEFIDDALNDPAEVCYEIADTWTDVHGRRIDDETLDRVFEVGQEWIRSLSKAPVELSRCPVCFVERPEQPHHEDCDYEVVEHGYHDQRVPGCPLCR